MIRKGDKQIFQKLIRVTEPVKETALVDGEAKSLVKYDDRGVLFQMPTNILFVLNEKENN